MNTSSMCSQCNILPQIRSRVMMFKLESVYFQKNTRYICTSCIRSPLLLYVLTFQDQKSMFKKYNKAGCIFECRLRYALKHANCIPWDYPLPLEHQEVPICVSQPSQVPSMVPNLTIFYNHMVSKESLQDCDCWDDCEGATYELQVITHKNT